MRNKNINRHKEQNYFIYTSSIHGKNKNDIIRIKVMSKRIYLHQDKKTATIEIKKRMEKMVSRFTRKLEPTSIYIYIYRYTRI